LENPAQARELFKQLGADHPDADAFRKLFEILASAAREQVSVASAPVTADVRVQLRGPAREAKFWIHNVGLAPAHDVNMSAVSKADGSSPLFRGDYDQKLPIPELLPNDVVTLMAAITMGSGTTFIVTTTWIDADGAEQKREQQVSLM